MMTETEEHYEKLLAEASHDRERYNGMHQIAVMEIDRLRGVLEAYEQWEADIILENKCWTGQNVCLTDELYDRMIELQTMRNAALARVGGTLS